MDNLTTADTAADSAASDAHAATAENPAPMETESTPAATDSNTSSPPKEETPSESSTMDQSAPPNNKEEEPQQPTEEAQPKKKAKIQTLSLTTQSMDSSMEKTVLTYFHELENEMISQDRQERDRQVAKNTLEEYVIEMRRKCGEELERFVEPQQREEFVRTLDGVEDWLYEDGEDVQKSIYVAKQLELQITGNPIVERFHECQSRPRAFDDLELTIQRGSIFVEGHAAANGEDEAIAHITKEDIAKLVDAVAKTVKWKSDKMEKQAKKPLTEAPAVMTSAINEERKKLEKVVNSVVNKPKPKKKEEKIEEKKDEEKENVNKEEAREDKEVPMEDGNVEEKENVVGPKGGEDENDAGDVIEEPKLEKKIDTGVNDATNDMDLD